MKTDSLRAAHTGFRADARTRPRLALTVLVSLVSVVPGGATRPVQVRGPNPGQCCDRTGTFDVRFTVKLDPANHHAADTGPEGLAIVDVASAYHIDDGPARPPGIILEMLA